MRTPQAALALEAADPELVLVGEVGGRPIPGFGPGNLPERRAALALAGMRIVLRSSSGVQGAARVGTAAVSRPSKGLPASGESDS